MIGLAQALEDLLTGKVTPEQADPRIMLWAEHAIWTAACEILSLTNLDDRRKALNNIPETIRPYVEREVKRMWEDRRDK